MWATKAQYRPIFNLRPRSSSVDSVVELMKLEGKINNVLLI